MITYIAPIAILLFSSTLKQIKYYDCIKYIKCMNLPKIAKTIMSTPKL